MIPKKVDEVNDVVGLVAQRLSGSVFKTMGEFENAVKKLMAQIGGQKFLDVEEQAKKLPGGTGAFYSNICNRILGRASIKIGA